MSDRFLEASGDATEILYSPAFGAQPESVSWSASAVDDDGRAERKTRLERANGEFNSDSLRAHEVLRVLGRRLGAAACELWRLPEDGGLEVLDSSWRDGQFSTALPEAGHHQQTHAQPLADGCDALEWIVDVASDERVGGDEWMRANSLRTLLRMPVRSAQSVLGSVRVYWRHRRVHDAAAADLVANGAGILGAYLEQAPSTPGAASPLSCFEALGQVTSDSLVVIDFRGRVVEANAKAQALLMRSRDALVGRALIELAVPERLRMDAAAALARLVAQPQPPGRRERLVTSVLLPNGQELAVSVDAAAWHATSPPIVLVSATPASACTCGAAGSERSRAQLRSLMTSLLVAEERERRRLAQDLHDGLSQLIALAQMKLAALSRMLRGRSDGQRAALDEIQALIISADRSARSVGAELSPPSLHQLGLAPALRWLVENLHERYGVTIHYAEPDPLPPLDETLNVILFRSVRELLINAAKHARASSIELSLREVSGRLVVRVRDDGVGMECEAAQSNGTGLVSMRERLAHVGGALRIESALGAGATVEIELPLPARTAQAGGAA